MLTRLLPFPIISERSLYCIRTELPRNFMLVKNISRKGMQIVESMTAPQPDSRAACTGQGSVDAAMTLPYSGMILLMSDFRAARRIFAEDPLSGPLSYLSTPLHRILTGALRHISTAWIKGLPNIRTQAFAWSVHSARC